MHPQGYQQPSRGKPAAGPRPGRPIVDPMAMDADAPTIMERVRALVSSKPLLNLTLVVAICVGFFHGWLKLHVRHPAVTFAFDAILLVALGLAYTGLDRRTRIVPGGKVGAGLFLFYGVCIAYAAAPFGPPILMSIAALRGWCFASLMYILGYHMTRNLTQVTAYFYVLIVLGVITAIYGIRQNPEEVARMIQQDEFLAVRLQGTYFATEGGRAELRRFSTVVSSGVFGSVMAYVITFALALLTDEREKKWQKALVGAAILPMAYGLVLTGARSSMASLGIGFAVVIWYRRKAMTLMIVPLALYLAMKWGSDVTEGAAMERFGTLVQKETISGRYTWPVLTAINVIMENPLGGGLGRSGYSIPFFLASRLQYKDLRPGEGDLPCLAIEMGVVGIIVFARLIYLAAKLVFDCLHALRDTPAASLALACGGVWIVTIIVFPIGSPFLSIPTGALTWFFLGTLQRIAHQHEASAPALPPANKNPGSTSPPRQRVQPPATLQSLNPSTVPRQIPPPPAAEPPTRRPRSF